MLHSRRTAKPQGSSRGTGTLAGVLPPAARGRQGLLPEVPPDPAPGAGRRHAPGRPARPPRLLGLPAPPPARHRAAAPAEALPLHPEPAPRRRRRRPAVAGLEQRLRGSGRPLECLARGVSARASPAAQARPATRATVRRSMVSPSEVRACGLPYSQGRPGGGQWAGNRRGPAGKMWRGRPGGDHSTERGTTRRRPTPCPADD